MTFNEDIKKHKIFYKSTESFINDCLDNSVSVEMIEIQFKAIIKDTIKNRNKRI